MSWPRNSRGYYYFLTLTAPGDRAHALPGGTRCPCTPTGGVNLAEWNASHSKRWNHLRTVFRQHHPALEFMRGIEVQARGALHDHAMIWSPSPLKEGEVRRQAVSAGFGHEVKLLPVQPGSKEAAVYVSKYVTKGADQRQMVPWMADLVNLDTGEVSRERVAGRYRTWSCSRGWGLRMKEVTARAQRYAQTMAGMDAAVERLRALSVLEGVLGPLRIVLDNAD